MELSLVCCVNRRDTFENCLVRSLEREGVLARIEMICIDNTANCYSAPQALNLGLNQAHAGLVACCHQDVRMGDGWLDRFLGQIALIERTDPHWGVAGLMGIRFSGAFAGHVKDPHTNQPFGRLPRRVQTLDEVFLALRQDSGLRFDENLGGFHMYGADLCLQARMQGLRCYAVDAPVEHLSGGRCDESFYQAAQRLRAKWHAVRGAPWIIETTCGIFPLRVGESAGASWLTRLLRLRRGLWRRLQGHTRLRGGRRHAGSPER